MVGFDALKPLLLKLVKIWSPLWVLGRFYHIATPIDELVVLRSRIVILYPIVAVDEEGFESLWLDQNRLRCRFQRLKPCHELTFMVEGEPEAAQRALLNDLSSTFSSVELHCEGTLGQPSYRTLPMDVFLVDHFLVLN